MCPLCTGRLDSLYVVKGKSEWPCRVIHERWKGPLVVQNYSKGACSDCWCNLNCAQSSCSRPQDLDVLKHRQYLSLAFVIRHPQLTPGGEWLVFWLQWELCWRTWASKLCPLRSWITDHIPVRQKLNRTMRTVHVHTLAYWTLWDS